MMAKSNWYRQENNKENPEHVQAGRPMEGQEKRKENGGGKGSRRMEDKSSKPSKPASTVMFVP